MYVCMYVCMYVVAIVVVVVLAFAHRHNPVLGHKMSSNNSGVEEYRGEKYVYEVYDIVCCMCNMALHALCCYIICCCMVCAITGCMYDLACCVFSVHACMPSWGVRQVVQPACLILERLAGESFHLVQFDFVDLVYTLLEMAASRYYVGVVTVALHLIWAHNAWNETCGGTC